MLLLSMCGCVDNKQTLHETILLKHQVYSLEHVSDYIDNGYDGIEFDLHISDTSLLVYYDSPQEAISFTDYVDFIEEHPYYYFWIDVKEFTLKGLLEFTRKMPPLSNCFIETNVDGIVDFLTDKNYNLVYTVRYIADWNESDSLQLKKEIDNTIRTYSIMGLASNHMMYYNTCNVFSQYPKYIWCVPANEPNWEISKHILSDPSVMVLLLDFDNVHELKEGNLVDY